MRKSRTFLGSTILAGWCALVGAAEMTRVGLQDNGAPLANPGMGWVFHHYDNSLSNYGADLAAEDTLDYFPGATVIYLRVPWSSLEPEEGRFVWALIDGPAQRWLAKGKQIAFRFTCSETGFRFATPEWVKNAGAKGYTFTPRKGEDPAGAFWEPDYADPVFLEKLEHFLAAAGQRYDGDPRVAFIDVGTFGVWGEGHLYSSTRRKYPAETIEKHIELHRKYFPHILLAANDDYQEEVIKYAAQNGLTLRDDSIMVNGGEKAYFHAAWAEWFWRDRPVILESEHYGPSKQKGCWADGAKYVQALEEYHASYVSIHWYPRPFYDECKDLIERMNQRLGYRPQALNAAWSAQVNVAGELTFESEWRNAGVAPCLPGGFPALTLKTPQGGIETVFVDEGFNLRQLPVAPPGQAESRRQAASFIVPETVRPGTYEVFLSVGRRDGTPHLALPLAGEDGTRRYRLGQISLLGRPGVYTLRAESPVRQEQEWRLPLKLEVRQSLPVGASLFLHFENAGSQIEFQGGEKEAPTDFSTLPIGGAELNPRFTVPPATAGREFAILAGIWLPEKHERLQPDLAVRTDKRILLGRIKVSATGEQLEWRAEP